MQIFDFLIRLSSALLWEHSWVWSASGASAWQVLARTPLSLISLRSEDIEGTPKLKVSAQIRGLGRQDEPVESMVARLSLEAGVTAVSWAISAQAIE